MMINFELKDESNNVIGINSHENRTYNGQIFKYLNKKKSYLEDKYKNLNTFKEKRSDLLSYYSFNPIKLCKNEIMRYKIKKSELNKFFIDSKEKRLHKDIYNSKLYDLINPYNLVKEKFLKSRQISNEIQRTFTEEQHLIKERENSINTNKYFDKSKNISFELLKKSDKNPFNLISDKKVLSNAIREQQFLVTLKNMNDSFSKVLLLSPSFTVGELELLIKFIYRAVYKEDKIEMINLYYYKSNIDSEILIMPKEKTLRELSKEMNSKIELEILIQTLY
jgi:hypothetical protein